MCHLRLAIQHQLGIKTGKAVIFGCKRHIVIGREVLEVNPALPGRHKWAILTAGLQLAKNILYLLPGRHVGIGVNAGSAHRIPVYPKNRCRRVKGQ